MSLDLLRYVVKLDVERLREVEDVKEVRTRTRAAQECVCRPVAQSCRCRGVLDR